LRENEENLFAQYEIINVIGSGAYGTVMKCLDTKINKIVAIKKIDLMKLNTAFNDTDSSVNEVEILQKIVSP